MNDHAAVYRHIRLTLRCYVLWQLETALGRGERADLAFADRDIQSQISADAKALTLEALGPVEEHAPPGPTIEQLVASELSETLARTEPSSRAEDRPVLASQVVSQLQAWRTRELLAIAFRKFRNVRKTARTTPEIEAPAVVHAEHVARASTHEASLGQ